MEADLQTVFSRPWTRLFVQSHKDKEVADRDTVGHRGSLIGSVEAIVGGGGPGRKPGFAFAPAGPWNSMMDCRSICPSQGKPFGFAIERLCIVSGPTRATTEAFEAPAG